MPILKSIGYKSGLLYNNGKYVVHFEKDGKMFEIPYLKMKEISEDMFFFADYKTKKYCTRASKDTLDALEHLSKNGKKSTYGEIESGKPINNDFND